MEDGKDTGKTNAPRLSLKLKSRHHSLERQSSARDLAVSEHRQDTDSANAISSQSDEIDDHFKEVLRRLVHRLIDSENVFYALGDRFYFQCASLRASKELQESLKREAKAKRAETQMEQDFTSTEQNITNIVRRELSAVESKRKKKSRKPVTNQKALASPKTGRKQRSKSKERGNSTTRQPNSRSQSRDRSWTQPRGRSRNRRDSRNSVSFNEPKRLQASKNSKCRGSGPVKSTNKAHRKNGCGNWPGNLYWNLNLETWNSIISLLLNLPWNSLEL